MIKEFVSGKWYRYIGPGKETDDISWNENGKVDFLLDGKPHQCNHGAEHCASFFDSPNPNKVWEFRRGLNYFKEVEMNDEMAQIEKLEKELARLKGIVETKKEKKIIYDRYNLYVGIDRENEPFLLAGYREYYRFHSFRDTEWGWSSKTASGDRKSVV